MATINRKQRLRITSRVTSQVALHATQGDKDAVFKTIFDGFSQLGGVYVKFLQILSARAEFRNVTSVSAQERSAVFDAVEPDPIDVHETLRNEIGAQYSDYLTNIQQQPFAAGSFGQVYFARHRDGTPVIIKVLRPSLLKYIRFDLRVLRMVLKLVDASPLARTFDMKDIFSDFKETVLTETNYPKEVENAIYFYEYFKDHPNVVIPKSYTELSSRNVLVQEYIQGIPLTELLIRHANGHDIAAHVQETLNSDLRTQLYALGHELLYATLAADRIPGDPHAGNIKLLPDNKIGLFDFGITADPPSNRLAFKEIMNEYIQLYNNDFDAGRLFVNAMRFFANRQYRAINTVATAVKNNDPDFDMMQELRVIVNKTLKQNSTKIDTANYIANAKVAPLFREAINENNRFALDIEFDGTVMLKAADTYMAMLDRVGLKQDLMPHIYESVQKRIDASDSTAELRGKSELMDLEQAIEIVGAWMQELIERDPLVFHTFVSKTRRGLGGNQADKQASVSKDLDADGIITPKEQQTK